MCDKSHPYLELRVLELRVGLELSEPLGIVGTSILEYPIVAYFGLWRVEVSVVLPAT